MNSLSRREPILEGWPRLRAGVAGFFYLLAVVAGAMTAFLDGRVIVRGDSAATVANVLSLEPLFRLSFASNVLATASCIAVTFLLYGVFREVDGRLSFVAAFLSAEACLVGGVVSVLHLAPLLIVKSAQALAVLDVQALRTLVLRMLELNSDAVTTAMLFFGIYSILIGYLALKSKFLPRMIGVLTALAGVVGIAGGLAPFLSPPLVKLLSACLTCLANFA